jgi:twinkle protein
VIKEKINGVAVDPFNQMTNDYGKVGGRSDKYLETVLSDFSRFAQANSLYLPIVAHPHKLSKQQDGNYPCPDVFDIADGAMWNNKMDNIIVYHRPFMQTQPENPTVEFHSKKIRRQKTVGKKGYTLFEYKRRTRRYEFDGIDYMAKLIKDKGLSFKKEQSMIPYRNEYLESLNGANPF